MATANYVRKNLNLLAEIWLEYRSGRVHVRGSGAVVPLSRGGLPGEAAWPDLMGHLDDGEIQFDPGQPMGVGNRALMAAFLQTASRRHRVMLPDLHRDRDAAPSLVQPFYAPLAALGGWTLEADPVAAQQEALLVEGRRLLALGEFQAADRVLVQARDLRMDHPDVLCCLAVARYYDVERPMEERLTEAQGLLCLARDLGLEDPQMICQAEALQRDLNEARFSGCHALDACARCLAANRTG